MSTSSIPKSLRRLGEADRLPEGSVNAYYLADLKHRVSVARVDGQLYAFDDLCTCTHPGEACPLSSGMLTATTIMCQCHGCRYDITNGSVVSGGAARGPGTYQVVESDGAIHVSI